MTRMLAPALPCAFAVLAIVSRCHAAIQVGAPTVDASGVIHYPVTSTCQTDTPNDLRILLPADPGTGQRRFLYVLPVEAGTESVYGDPVEAVRALGVVDSYHLILVVPAFSQSPWYADHPSDPAIQQESYFVEDLVPAVEKLYPETVANPGPPRRLLVGFSKSGLGAMSLILRHSTTFDVAAAWDAPLNRALLWGPMGAVFGTQADYEKYALPSAWEAHASEFQSSERLWLGGYSSQDAWRNDMIAAHDKLTSLSVPHAWVDGPQRAHHWASGWIGDAIEFAHQKAPAQSFEPPQDAGAESAATDGSVEDASIENTAETSSQDSASAIGDAVDAVAEADAARAFGPSADDQGSCACRASGRGSRPGMAGLVFLLSAWVAASLRSRRMRAPKPDA